MMDERPNDVTASPRASAAVTNGTKLLLTGDGRSAGARRYRDLVRLFAEPLGGLTALGAIDQQIVRRAAQTSVECEILEAERAAGHRLDPVAYSRVLNASRRALKDLQSLKPAKPARPTWDEHIAKTYGDREPEAA